MHGKEGVVELWVNKGQGERVADIAVRHHLRGGKRQLPAEQQGQAAADEEKEERTEQVLETDDLMIEGPEVFFPPGGFMMVMMTLGVGVAEGGGAHGFYFLFVFCGFAIGIECVEALLKCLGIYYCEKLSDLR
jgi:hypothetical protein